MFCVKCGATLPDGANFCPNCGAPANRAKGEPGKREVKTVQFRCKGCGHVMEIDPDSPVLRCSVCGSNELILEGDNVTVQRIKSNAYKDVELGKQQTYKDVELGKKELEIKGDNARFKRHIVSYIIIILGAVVTYLGIYYVSLLTVLIGIIVLIAGIVSRRFSKKAPKEEKYRQSEFFSQDGRPVTKEDVELAKVRAKEREDRRGWLIMLLLLLFIFAGLYFLDK